MPHELGDPNPFDVRRQSEPQGVIDDLLAQTTRQGREIHRLNNELEVVRAERDRLQKKQVELYAALDEKDVMGGKPIVFSDHDAPPDDDDPPEPEPPPTPAKNQNHLW